MTSAAVTRSTSQFWDDSIVPALVDYIRLPAKSPHFDPDWASRGHIDAAVKLAAQWCRQHAVPGMKLEVVRLGQRTPVLLVEIPGKGEGNILVYGHLDKQPEMTGWRDGLGPWTPKIEGEKLYGSIQASDIAAKLKELGYDLDKRAVLLPEPIKQLGMFSIKIQLHRDVEAKVKLWIISDESK